MPEPTAVICGATAGVGRASAEAFARAGYRVALIARGEQGLSDTQAQLEALGARVLAIAADVADAPALEAAATRVEAELGPIDVWVNAAMATVFGPFSALTPEEIRRVTEVTYLGSVHGTLTALRHMRPRNRGTIVQVGSALAYRAIPLQSAYCGAKFAIRGFIDSLRCELIHDKSAIRLTMVQLPAHNTPQFDWARNRMSRRAQPVPPIHTPDVAARAILRAARNDPGYAADARPARSNARPSGLGWSADRGTCPVRATRQPVRAGRGSASDRRAFHRAGRTPGRIAQCGDRQRTGRWRRCAVGARRWPVARQAPALSCRYRRGSRLRRMLIQESTASASMAPDML